MDWLTLALTFLLAACLAWLVGRAAQRAEERIFLQGYDACALAEHARQQERGAGEQEEVES